MPKAPMPDPRDRLDAAPMSSAQVRGVVVTALLSALDGYDLLATAFVAPALARAFGAGPDALGLVLSAGLFGTLLGAVLMAPLADRFGRRPVVLASLLLMTVGMGLSAAAGSLESLAVIRVATGVGVGALMVVVNPAAAELANARRRPFVVAIKSIGFPIGGVAGGWLAAVLQTRFGWPSVFLFGAVLGLVLIPVVVRALPESLVFLIERRPPRALDRVNRLLSRFGHPPVEALPPATAATLAPLAEIFGPDHRRRTLSGAVIGLLVWGPIFFFLSWQTQMLTQAGFTAVQAAAVAGWSSLAGAAGVLGFALATRRGGRVVPVLSVAALGGALALFGLAQGQTTLIVLSLAVGGAVTGATVAVYVVITAAFPARIVATGSGLVVGAGRLGSAAGPALAGLLFANGFDRALVAGIMGLCALAAAGLMWRMLRPTSLLEPGAPGPAGPRSE